jgi:hypothetical protein
VDPQSQVEALRAHLQAARQLTERGERQLALTEVDAALAIDPQFLAARALRDRIVSPPRPSPPRLAGREGTKPPPLVSPERYSHFEARARKRRLDHRLDAARTAIASRRFADAASALDEVQQLDPSIGELPALRASLASAQARRRKWHPAAPWIVGAAACALLLLVPSWLKRATTTLPSQSLVAPALPIVPTALPLPVSLLARSGGAEVPTSGSLDSDADSAEPIAIERPDEVRATPKAAPPAEVAAAPPVIPREVPPASTPAPARAAANETPPAAEPIAPSSRPASTATKAPDPTAIPPPSAPLAAPSVPIAAANPPANIPAPFVSPSSIPVAVDEEALVRQALQRYRAAYDLLDARRAHEIWPNVNEAALARAFDGLASQTLKFDECRVQVRNGVASATCRGSARYVTKVGGRDPRIEPRVWNFTLRRTGSEWRIDTARTER